MGIATVARGARASRRRSIAGGSPAFRAAAKGNDEATGNNSTSLITVPGSVQAGDIMCVVGAQNTSGAVTFSVSGGGSGATWTTREGPDTVSSNNLRAYLWTSRATGSSAGSTITVSSSTSARFPALLLVASGVTDTGILTEVAFVNTVDTSHLFPSVTVVTGGSLLVGMAALRSGTATAATLTAPAGSTLDDSSNTNVPASPSITVAGLHGTSTVAAGVRTPGTATSSSSVTAILYTVALAPA